MMYAEALKLYQMGAKLKEIENALGYLNSLYEARETHNEEVVTFDAVIPHPRMNNFHTFEFVKRMRDTKEFSDYASSLNHWRLNPNDTTQGILGEKFREYMIFMREDVGMKLHGRKSVRS